MERSYQKIDRRKTRTINVGGLKIGGKNPILVTALNSKIGYEAGAKIVKKAYQEKRSIGIDRS